MSYIDALPTGTRHSAIPHGNSWMLFCLLSFGLLVFLLTRYARDNQSPCRLLSTFTFATTTFVGALGVSYLYSVGAFSHTAYVRVPYFSDPTLWDHVQHTTVSQVPLIVTLAVLGGLLVAMGVMWYLCSRTQCKFPCGKGGS